MRKIIIILIIGLTFIIAFDAIAQLGTGANFLKLGIGARQLGMGSAFTGVSDDLYTIYWNPAGLGRVRWWEISTMYNNYFADMYYFALSGVKQYRILGSRKTAVGLGVFYHGMPEWDSTEGRATEKGSANDMMAIAAFGQRMDWLTKDISVGLNIKLGRSSLADYTAWTIASDLGILYQLDVLNRPLSLGISLQNIGFQTRFIKEKSPIPLGFRCGASYRLLYCDYHNLILATDLAKYKYGNFKLGLGAEYWFYNLVGVRSGYAINQKDLGDLSFGVSVRLDAFDSGIQTDYTRSNYGEVFGYNSTGAVSLNSVSPEPFRLRAPQNGTLFCPKNVIKLSWENSPDPDACDVVSYRVLIDPDKNKVQQGVKETCDTPENKSSVFLDLHTRDIEIQLPELPANRYYWTAIAVDRKNHTRWCEEIRSFVKGAPDLIIKELTFIPSDTLPDLNDNYQGNVIIVIENRGLCPGYDFRVTLSDSFCCENRNIIVQEYEIDSLNPGEMTSRPYQWRSDMIGKHQFKAIVNPENGIDESDLTNNSAICVAVTIPRGRVIAERDTLNTRKIIFTYSEIPIVPTVFFENNSAIISTDYYQEDLIRPTPMLKVIANRLNKNENLKILLSGYIDPLTEKENQSLARERMHALYSLVLDSLKVSSEQVKMKTNYDVTTPRIRQAPDPMIIDENRRVEIVLEGNDREQHSELFGPFIAFEKPRIDNGMVFHTKLTANLEIVCWQLHIRDRVARKTLYRTPFKIETGSLFMKDSTVWVGIDEELRPVNLNESYSYLIKVEDQLGREFMTRPKRFFLNCEFVQEQEKQVHLNKFDAAIEYFSFDKYRLTDLAKKLIQSPTMRIKFNGYACEIGTVTYNMKLAQKRADEFREQFIDSLKHVYQQMNDPYEKWEDLLKRVDKNLSYEELAKKFAAHPGSFAEPLKYCNLCTLKEYIFPMNDVYGRNLSRRVDIVLYNEKNLKPDVKEGNE